MPPCTYLLYGLVLKTHHTITQSHFSPFLSLIVFARVLSDSPLMHLCVYMSLHFYRSFLSVSGALAALAALQTQTCQTSSSKPSAICQLPSLNHLPLCFDIVRFCAASVAHYYIAELGWKSPVNALIRSPFPFAFSRCRILRPFSRTWLTFLSAGQ